MEVGAYDLQEAIHALYYWQYCDATNFSARLYELIAKADLGNRIRLNLAFPVEVYAFTLWENTDSIEEFFKAAGVWPTPTD